MRTEDVRDIYIKIRKKYSQELLSPQILSDIVHILFSYIDSDNQPERSKREDYPKGTIWQDDSSL